MPSDEHDRRVRRELDVDVVGARAARRRPRSRVRPVPRTSSTIRSGSQPATPGGRRARRRSSASPAIGVDRRARVARRRERACSSASPWTASWRRAASSEASSSELGDVERTSRTARATRADVDAAGRRRRAASRSASASRRSCASRSARRRRRSASALGGRPGGSRSAGPTPGRRRAARRRRARPARSPSTSAAMP